VSNFIKFAAKKKDMTETSSNEIIINDEQIINKIYLIRNQKVMLDKDLAKLYDVKPIRLREQVRRNFDKFPSHFMFQLTEIEVEIMVSQNAIPSKSALGGALPYVFTEHGALQLANVIKSGRATQVSIRIIDIFVRIRQMLMEDYSLRAEIEQIKNKIINQDKNIELIFSYLDEFIEKQENPRPRNPVGYKTQEKN
jgi:hypothetical protein